MIWYSMQWSENRFIGVIIVLSVVKEIKILKAEIFLVGKHIDEPQTNKVSLVLATHHFYKN
jgi:hypothetical protein